MILSKTTIIGSFLLIIVANCFGMELPKDQPLINNAERAALFDILDQKAPEALPNDEGIEALFGNTEALLNDADLAKEIQKTLPSNEKVDLGNDNEADKETNAISVSKRRRYECPACKKSVAELTLHMRTHTGEKLFTCNQCDYSFTSRNHLMVHQRTHTGEKPYQCDQCDYSSTQNSNLIRHKRTHTDEKPFPCNQCNYSCASSSDLTKHTRTHTGEKPFKCERCDYSSASSSDLTRHKRKHI